MSNLLRRHDIIVASYVSSGEDDYGNPVESFNEHYTIEGATLNATTGNTALQMYGDRVTRMVRTFIDYDKYIGRVKEKDRAYLYGATPDGEGTIGGNANYVIVAVLPQNKKIQVLFERLP